jgi:hypothetical protein
MYCDSVRFLRNQLYRAARKTSEYERRRKCRSGENDTEAFLLAKQGLNMVWRGKKDGNREHRKASTYLYCPIADHKLQGLLFTTN